MRDKRPVDELSIEELERILAIRKREERQGKLQRMKRAGRVVTPQPPTAPLTISTTPGAQVAQSPAPASTPSSASTSAEPQAVRTATPQFEDEASYFTPATAKDADRARFWRSFTNQSLLLVEVLAVVGLVFLGYTMITAVNRLQEETASAQALADEQRRLTIPTLEPTPQIRLSQVVLPGGHVFTETGEVRFNIEEIPEMFRSQVASELTQPVIFRPPPTRETALQLSIPDLNLDQTIVPGVDWDALKLGIGQLQNDVNPGDPEGNLVLAGHNDIYGEYFRYLDQLEAGDEFFIRTETTVYTYRVTEWQIIEPTDVWVYNPRGGATATLISCWPYRQSDKRIAVFAERVD